MLSFPSFGELYLNGVRLSFEQSKNNKDDRLGSLFL